MLALEVAILNERGGRSVNEDSCGHWHSGGALCAVLADGAGGHGGGQHASRVAVERMLRLYAEHPSANGSQLSALVQATNASVRAERATDAELANMHSTVVCLVIDYVRHKAHWSHAGDSRMYWFRDRTLLRRTLDHSVVQGLVEGGLLTDAEARVHPKRSELRSALGTEEDQLEIDDSGEPLDVRPGDVFLLCTDGVWEHIPDEVMEATLRTSLTANGWLDAIESSVLGAARGKEHHDNFSAISVWALDHDTASAQGDS